jgi:hypothetical protein
MKVRLTVKLADLVNGIDLSHCVEGDVIDLSERDARMLIQEGWAEEAPREVQTTCTPVQRGAVAADTRPEAPQTPDLGSGGA